MHLLYNILLLLSNSFLANALFIGSATSSLQIEGHNKGITIWDEYVLEKNLHPINNASNHYIQYKEDIKLINDMGSKDYRFSISMSRIMPHKWMEIDEEGINFYHNIIDECLSYNITPYVTLYHWELPNYLSNDEFSSWLDYRIVNYFKEFAILVFEEYSDKVKNWMTINEPLTTSLQGYGEICNFPPGNCSLYNQYLSAHNQLLAHAHVGNFYMENYDGQIGLVINSNWFEPFNENSIIASNIMMNKTLGWFLDPIIRGTYPNVLFENLDFKFKFSETEQYLLKNSFNFIGINHYTTYYMDENFNYHYNDNWIKSKANWLYIVPYGIRKLLNYINIYYTNNYDIYITECGMPQVASSINDFDRIHYLSGYLFELQSLQYDNVKGFFIWSLLDNFEWIQGYNESFGIIEVNYNNNYQRTPKLSYYLFQSFLKGQTF
tara:strand:- start:2466 stop:3773 length:1308 start_codon:yes stop_codon:yes gene_type:complete